MKEKTSMDEILEKVPDTVTREMIRMCYYNYDKLARRDKYLYFALQGLIIGLSLCATVMSVLAGQGIVPDGAVTVVVALSTAVIAVENLFQFKEAWHRKRRSAEKIQIETVLYIKKIGEYNDSRLAEKDLDKKFVENIVRLETENFHGFEEFIRRDGNQRKID